MAEVTGAQTEEGQKDQAKLGTSGGHGAPPGSRSPVSPRPGTYPCPSLPSTRAGSDQRADRPGVPHDVKSSHPGTPAIGLQKRGEHPDQSRLAGAVRPQQSLMERFSLVP
jgi:hypothetical protein